MLENQAHLLTKLSDDKRAEGEEETKINVVCVLPSQGLGNDKKHAGVMDDSALLIYQLGWDMSINCLLGCSRSDFGSIASLNRSFRSLIRSGELYRLRRQMGIVENWVYLYSNTGRWEAFDPNRGRWMELPTMNWPDCFLYSHKESLAVGTELLVFGKGIPTPVIYKYSLLNNSWSSGMEMNVPRYEFGFASLGEIAIVAGGCDPNGNILSAAELYNYDTGKWETLPNMNKARKRCSCVFMDGKFYVLGGFGTGRGRRRLLTCGEVFDLKTRKWSEIPNMSPARNRRWGGFGNWKIPLGDMAPPLVAVVNNVLYSVDYARKKLRRYVKQNNSWVTIGGFPSACACVNGYGIGFKACGDRLIFVAVPVEDINVIQVHAWLPDEGAPQWNLLGSGRKYSGKLLMLYNCAVMGC